MKTYTVKKENHDGEWVAYENCEAEFDDILWRYMWDCHRTKVNVLISSETETLAVVKQSKKGRAVVVMTPAGLQEFGDASKQRGRDSVGNRKV